MKAVDTNILARFVLRDDEHQTRLAQQVLREPAWVSNTVWLELGWLLDKRLGLAREAVADAIETLLAIDVVHTADRPGLAWAIERYRRGADWADMVHLVAAQGAADAFITFDRTISRRAGPKSPLAVETLT